MGIKDLKALIRKHSPNGITIQDLSSYSNKVIAIDISIYFYRFLSYGNHLSGLVRQILLLLDNRITPLYVFDGKPPEEKSDVLKERKEKKEKLMADKLLLEEKLAEAENPNEIETLKKTLWLLSRELICVTPEHNESAKQLFDLFGVPYLVADGEAEILCAKLCKLGYVDGCLSEDTDLLPNGSKIFINNFKVTQRFVQEFNLNIILSEMNITHDQFIDICILCGCDYTNKIEGLAKDGAYALIKKLGNIEGIIQYINHHKKTVANKYTVPNDFNYQRAREIFNTSIEELVDPNLIVTKMNDKVNIDKLELFVHNNCERLSKKYLHQIRKILGRYHNDHKKYKFSEPNKNNQQITTKTIDSYFKPIQSIDPETE